MPRITDRNNLKFNPLAILLVGPTRSIRVIRTCGAAAAPKIAQHALAMALGR